MSVTCKLSRRFGWNGITFKLISSLRQKRTAPIFNKKLLKWLQLLPNFSQVSRALELTAEIVVTFLLPVGGEAYCSPAICKGAPQRFPYCIDIISVLAVPDLSEKLERRRLFETGTNNEHCGYPIYALVKNIAAII